MKTDGKQKHNVAVPLHHVKQATPSTESLCKRKKLLKDKDDKACLKKTRNPASKTSLEEVSHPPKVIPHTAIANEILVSKTCDNASKKPSPNVCHRPGSCSSQNQPSANVLTSSCDYLDVPPSDSTGVQESESQNNNTSSENDSQKLTSAHETVNSSTGDVQEIEPAVSVVASPVRRPVRGRSQKPNPKSDSELYSNARLKAILEVLRSNLTAEEKLRAIKQSHDHWEKHDRVNLMSDPARKITGTDMVEPHEHILPKSDSLHDLNFSDFKPDTLQKNLKSDISCTVTSPKDQVEEVSESTFNSSPQPKRAVLTSDSIQDGTCSEQLLSPKHAKKSDRLETESSSCLSAVPTVTCTTLLTPTVSSECFLDSEFQDSKPTCDPWACESNDNRKFLKLDTKLFAPDNGVSPPKSPLTVQEWVDSLERPSCLETQNEENAFSNTESKEDGDCSGQTESGISFPSSDLTAEDNLKLGAEAYNLEDSQHEDLAPRKSDSLNGAETSSTPNRISLSELRTKQSSFNSETSGFSTVSSISSIESLLDARREDPEEILFALGFGGRPSDDPLKRIPVRFLSQPSVAAGIDIDSFIRNQEELQQKDFSGLGYLGLSGQYSLSDHLNDTRSSWSLPMFVGLRPFNLQRSLSAGDASGSAKRLRKERKMKKSMTVKFQNGTNAMLPNCSKQSTCTLPLSAPLVSVMVTLSPAEDDRDEGNREYGCGEQSEAWWQSHVCKNQEDVVIGSNQHGAPSNYSYSSSDTCTSPSYNSRKRHIHSSLV